MYFRVMVIRNKTFTIVETISLAFFPCLSSKWSFHRMNHFFFFFKLTRNTNRGQHDRDPDRSTVNARAIFASCSMQVKLLYDKHWYVTLGSTVLSFLCSNFLNNILYDNISKTMYKLNATFFESKQKLF